MKKSLFIAALATLALASCSKNEVIELQQDQIKFSAVADNASRGVNNASSIQGDANGFAVLGYLTGTKTLYIGKSVEPYYDVAKWDNTANAYKTNETYYWPTTGLDIEAIYPMPEANTHSLLTLYKKDSGDKRSTLSLYQEYDVTKQKDILYAVRKGVTKGDVVSGCIPLNFRHALSQIVFSAGVTSGVNLEVIIQSISFENNLPNTTYLLPNANTHDNLNVDNGTITQNNDTWATVGNQSYTDGTREFDNKSITVTKELKLRGIQMGVEEAVAGYKEYTSSTNSPMFMIPHERRIDNSDSEAPFNIVVNCQINSLSADGTSKVRLFPASGEFGDLKQEIAIDWKQGVKYHYKLNFEQSVETIQFSITVDEYQTKEEVINVPVG